MVNIPQNISLKKFNTFGIDQKAKFFIEANDNQSIIDVFKTSEWAHVAKLILGGGSNILFCSDFDGLIVKINTKGITFEDHDDSVLVTAQAGEVWHEFVLFCVEKGWGGLENLSLIPGCVGAAPIQNIGAYGIEVKDAITKVEVFDSTDFSIKTLNNIECEFGYRDSLFKHVQKNRYVVLSVTFALQKNPKLNTSYGAINDVLKAKGITNPTIKDISNAVIEIRTSKLPNPKEIGNAGSFFKNPEIEPVLYQKIKKSYPDVPSFATNSELVKIPAGWLIEKSGWKGKTFGNYGVHKNQALVLVNYGGAKGSDIKQLSMDIQEDVFRKFGIRLANEVNFIE